MSVTTQITLIELYQSMGGKDVIVDENINLRNILNLRIKIPLFTM